MDRARCVMSSQVITIHDDATLGEAIATLLKHKISGMPVVDDQQRLIGIISEFQLLEAVYTPAIKRDYVRDAMTEDVMTVAEDASLSEIATLFVLHRIRRIPVVRGDKVVGIVTRRDLLRNVAETEQLAAKA
ncbi:MAG: CBS domain-containing protein [Pirellulales bacterium]|nr:CBS domain-containing protein [Pirellulales bacterium]